MNFFHVWGIPLLVLFAWVALTLFVIRPVMNRLKRKEEQNRHDLHALILSALGAPLVLFLLGVGLNLFIDMLPDLPAKWEKYITALLLILFASAGYLFLDRLMLSVLRRYSKTVDVIASSAGIMRTLYRGAIMAFTAFIILDYLKITITPFLASLGIGGLIVALALQDTLSNYFSGIYLFFDKPVRIGDYVRLESGEEGYVMQVGWHSTRIQLLSNNTVIISNAKLAGSRITNFYFPDREVAVLVNVGVAHGSDLDKVEKITAKVAREVLNETEGAVKDFEPFVRFNGFDGAGVNFTTILRAREYVNQYAIIHEFIKRLYRHYQQEGIGMPASLQSVYTREPASETKDRDERKET